MYSISSKVQPAEIYVHQFQSSGTVYPSVQSITQSPAGQQQHQFSELQFVQTISPVLLSSGSGTNYRFVPVAGLVDNLAPTITKDQNQKQASGDQAAPSKKLSSQYFKAKMDQLGTQVKELPSRMGPWALFFDPKQFSVPSSSGDVLERFRGNLQYFYANYAIISAILLAYCLLTSPLLLIGAALYGLLAYSILQRNQDLVLFNQSITRNYQLLGLTICFIPLFVFLGISGVFFWLIGVTTCVIVLHSLFHNAPQLGATNPNAVHESGLSGDVHPDAAGHHHNGGSSFQVITL